MTDIEQRLTWYLEEIEQDCRETHDNYMVDDEETRAITKEDTALEFLGIAVGIKMILDGRIDPWKVRKQAAAE